MQDSPSGAPGHPQQEATGDEAVVAPCESGAHAVGDSTAALDPRQPHIPVCSFPLESILIGHYV